MDAGPQRAGQELVLWVEMQLQKQSCVPACRAFFGGCVSPCMPVECAWRGRYEGREGMGVRVGKTVRGGRGK